ncbi:phosphatase PAP2 family protein [Herbidospora cretacea]|uniref:phosphatase PAP2 family protein n=1 Tax=Herbidospora cretacea TaxID=28444 RepID=UPI001FE0F436|nr:phosphatase PAP2 family protein [Herbidospora cretacea]
MSGPDGALGARLTVAALAAAILLVPFMLLLVLVKSAFTPLNRLDQGVAADLHAYALQNPAFADVMRFITDALAPETWRVLVGGAAVYMVLRGAPRLAIWAVTTVIVGGVIGLAVKVVVERARPMLPEPVSWAPGWSFPSGHALNAALGAVTLVLVLLPVLHGVWRAVAWVVAALVSLTVAFTRVALGVHWVSDVVAGIILALVVVFATTAAFEAWRRRMGRPPVEPHMQGVEPESVAPKVAHEPR